MSPRPNRVQTMGSLRSMMKPRAGNYYQCPVKRGNTGIRWLMRSLASLSPRSNHKPGQIQGTSNPNGTCWCALLLEAVHCCGVSLGEHVYNVQNYSTLTLNYEALAEASHWRKL